MTQPTITQEHIDAVNAINRALAHFPHLDDRAAILLVVLEDLDGESGGDVHIQTIAEVLNDRLASGGW